MKTAMLIGILFSLTTVLLALSGFGTSAPVVNDTVDPSLSILSPNGGEAWYIGDTNDITWTATNSNNNIGFRCVSIFVNRICPVRTADHRRENPDFYPAP